MIKRRNISKKKKKKKKKRHGMYYVVGSDATIASLDSGGDRRGVGQLARPKALPVAHQRKRLIVRVAQRRRGKAAPLAFNFKTLAYKWRVGRVHGFARWWARKTPGYKYVGTNLQMTLILQWFSTTIVD